VLLDNGDSQATTSSHSDLRTLVIWAPKGRKKGTARKSLNKKLAAEIVEISDDSFSVDNTTDNQEANERKKAFLQSNNKSSNLQKTSQSTLSFTKGGLQMTNKTTHMTMFYFSCQCWSCQLYIFYEEKLFDL
jgi:hypothetical protein